MSAARGAAAEQTNGHKPVSLSELLAQPLPFEDVPIPEYGPDAMLRLYAVSGAERQRLADLSAADETSGEQLEFQHEVIASALGPGHTPEQVAQLPSTAIDRLTSAALRLVGLDLGALAAEVAKLKAIPSADSGSKRPGARGAA